MLLFKELKKNKQMLEVSSPENNRIKSYLLYVIKIQFAMDANQLYWHYLRTSSGYDMKSNSEIASNNSRSKNACELGTYYNMVYLEPLSCVETMHYCNYVIIDRAILLNCF